MSVDMLKQKMYLHRILGYEMESRRGFPRGVPAGILKMENYCQGLKVRFPMLYPPHDLRSYSIESRENFATRISYFEKKLLFFLNLDLLER